jgi:hypothetical protein
MASMHKLFFEIYKTFTNSNIIIFSLLGTGEGSPGSNKPKQLSTSLGGS